MKAKSSFVSKIRDWFWEIPDNLIFGHDSFASSFASFYGRTRPFSHLTLSFVVYITIFVALLVNPLAVLRIETNEFIEGSIVGTDEQGRLRGLTSIDPLVPSSIQLENDIVNLMYDELVRVTQDGKIIPQLVEDEIEEIKKGNHYRFRLRQDVVWHDGKKLTTKDVEATMQLLAKFNEDSNRASQYSNVVVNQFDKIIINQENPYIFEIKLKDPNAVLPTFFESLSFKIVPYEYAQNFGQKNVFGINTDIQIPSGTGVFRDPRHLSAGRIQLLRNDSYYGSKPNIDNITFRLFADEDSAVEALKSGSIHAISGLSTDKIKQVRELKNFEVYNSLPIYNQYWALHFNLNTDTGNEALQDVFVRRAFAYATDREGILSSIERQGVGAYTVIPTTSFAYKQDLAKREYDLAKARELLEQQDWKINPKTGIRQKKGRDLEINIVYVDNVDRDKIANVIKSNLESIGVRVNLQKDTIDVVNRAHILPRRFDILLYGAVTFKDPDRYELFHSSQIKIPEQDPKSTGLNVMSYISAAQTVRIDAESKKDIKIPKVDVLLEEARSIIDDEKRKEKLDEFQVIINDEVPLIVLYNPTHTYVVNKRVKNVVFVDFSAAEDRFMSIHRWEINQ